ncbi:MULTISPECIES: hypothetical protein [unclassified Xenorhabdus]|uniref:hypothetical protein n=1 Tax=Xenorhabdus TaxID=626 RepID=UPI000C04B26C|nr:MULTISPECIES: hypothetical protein [unclassified Xenorhabdus]MCC8380764.1 hypothetical protein [Xenorhabdus sp. PB30.3]PHM48531.1 hypothetical protein Xekk_04423 [Xenorhabdus sp. KK7.4]
MTMLKERQHMIVRAMNDKNHVMKPISKEKLQFLGEAFGWDQLADDINYLVKVGLVNHFAIHFDDNGGYGFNPDSMALTAAGVDYANMDTIDDEMKSFTIKVHKNTLEQIETVIKTANIPDNEKKVILEFIREQGIETVLGKCIDTLLTKVDLAMPLFSEVANMR